MSKPAKTVWIMAGEKSGDLYGARLARELKGLEPDITVRGMGGESMAQAGVDLMVDSTELAVVGLVEVLKHIGEFRAIFRMLVDRAATERPDAVVLIDYPGFNIRLAKQLHRLGIKVIYYVSPQVWAWGKRRIPKLAAWVDKMLVIFPFETDVYASTGLDVEFVGHPLLEIMNEVKDPALQRDNQTVLLLPGSRRNEVKTMLPVMIEAALWLHGRNPRLKFVLSMPTGSVADLAEQNLIDLTEGTGLPVDLVRGQTTEWMQRAGAGMAASGTVTMEAAILGLPLAVGYKLNQMTYWMAKVLVKLDYFTIVNLVADRLVYAEYLQHEANAVNLGQAVEAILLGGARHKDVHSGMRSAVEALGARSNVCLKAAQAVCNVINQSSERQRQGA